VLDGASRGGEVGRVVDHDHGGGAERRERGDRGVVAHDAPDEARGRCLDALGGVTFDEPDDEDEREVVDVVELDDDESSRLTAPVAEGVDVLVVAVEWSGRANTPMHSATTPAPAAASQPVSERLRASPRSRRRCWGVTPALCG